MIIYAQCTNCEGAKVGTNEGEVTSCTDDEVVVSSPTKKCVEDNGECHEQPLTCSEGQIKSGGLQSCDGLPASQDKGCIKDGNNCKEVTICSKAKKGDDGITKCEGFPVSNSKKYTCTEIKDDSDGNCKEVDKPSSTTNSGNILKAFKMIFALIIVFTIL